MIVRQFADEVIDKLLEAADTQARQTGRGGCETIDAYRQQVGVFRGLKQAAEIVSQSIDEFEKREDQDL